MNERVREEGRGEGSGNGREERGVCTKRGQLEL